MLKTAILPAVLAIVVGLAGSAGYSVMQSRSSYTAHVVVQDSIAKVRMDSIMADSAALAKAALQAQAEEASADSALHALSTPADSIRALVSERNQQAAEVSPPASIPLTPAASIKPETADAPKIAPPVSRPESPVTEVLPERRLAKIFSAMSSKDAAKVLGQMSDSDIRTILSMMGDRQAAAVLTALPASRAAAITRAGATTTGSSTP